MHVSFHKSHLQCSESHFSLSTVVDWSPSFWIDTAGDLIFYIDMAVSFRTGVFLEEGDVSFDYCVIAEKYAKGWLTIDFLSTFPVDVVIVAMFQADKTLARSTKFLRVLKLFRLVKLLRLLKLSKGSKPSLDDDWVNFNQREFRRGTESAVLVALFSTLSQLIQFNTTCKHFAEAGSVSQMFISITFLSHLVACVWYYASTWSTGISESWASTVGVSEQSKGCRSEGIATHHLSFCTVST